MSTSIKFRYARPFDTITNQDVKLVGGKNASLGEMVQGLKSKGIRVPDGFATTADAYRHFLEHNHLPSQIDDCIQQWKNQQASLEDTGRKIRRLILKAEFPNDLKEEIQSAYQELSKKYQQDEVDVAVRSSATAEDLPKASFAGQQESYLNIKGLTELMEACRKCYASLFTDRAISYRQEQGFDQLEVALSIGVQKMVRSDKAGSGVMFTLDPETGFPDVTVINAAWGLGENVVKGRVNPDEYIVFKPKLSQQSMVPIIEKRLGDKKKTLIYAHGGTDTTKNVDTSAEVRDRFVLTDDDILCLGRWSCIIEDHYQHPMDIEWAKDGISNELYIVQARPETVQSQKQKGLMQTYELEKEGNILLTGLSVGNSIASGNVCIIHRIDEQAQFQNGDILVTEMTDPDWVPLMRRAAGVITNSGGRTCHAAIVSREFGIPAVVGTEHGTRTLKQGQEITLSCVQGDNGIVYEGKLPYQTKQIDVTELPTPPVDILINIGSPDSAFRWWQLPVQGIGLARMEFIIANIIKIHPMALLHIEQVEDKDARKEIEHLTRHYERRSDYFVDHLAQGIGRIAASQYPNPVIVRTSDFKTNEYAGLIGGSTFEPSEHNPMLGFRGASRYGSDRYREGFALECEALRRVRETMGLDNVIIMIPFCRTVEEADKVLEQMKSYGLTRGQNGLQVYVMAEIPSNILLAKQFAERFDGFSIGSNDLTQLVLGIDRDSSDLSYMFDERNPAVERMIQELITKAHESKRKVGLCGQGPSDHPDFAEFLMQAGIDSISLNPDSVIPIIERLTSH